MSQTQKPAITLPSALKPEYLIVLLIMCSAEVPVGVSYALVCATLLLFLARGTDPHSIFDALGPVRLLVLLAPVGALFALQNDTYMAVKDGWYLSKAILMFCVGYVVALHVKSLDEFIELYVVGSVLMCLIYLARFFFALSYTGGNVFAATNLAGIANVLTVFALPLMFRRDVNFVFVRGGMKIFVIATMLETIISSYSRTYIACTLIACFALSGLLKDIRRAILAMAIIGVLGGVSAMWLLSSGGSVSESAGGIPITFQSKIAHSLTELAFTDASDTRDMIHNWRGFEAYMAFLEFEKAPLAQKIAGRGWGATVDLGMEVQMSDTMSFRYLPILHNGYFHIIGKYGVVGLLLYTAFFIGIIRGAGGWKRGGHPLLRDFRIALGLIIGFSTLVITGLLNILELDGVLIMLGTVYGISSRQRDFDILAMLIEPARA